MKKFTAISALLLLFLLPAQAQKKTTPAVYTHNAGTPLPENVLEADTEMEFTEDFIDIDWTKINYKYNTATRELCIYKSPYLPELKTDKVIILSNDFQIWCFDTETIAAPVRILKVIKEYKDFFLILTEDGSLSQAISSFKSKTNITPKKSNAESEWIILENDIK